MNKKAAITLFIIIGIVMLLSFGAVIGIYSAMKDRTKEPVREVPLEVKPIEKFVQECFEDVSKIAVYYNSLNSGYYNRPIKTVRTDLSNPAIYLDNGDDFSPSLIELENQIKYFIEDNIDKYSAEAYDI